MTTGERRPVLRHAPTGPGAVARVAVARVGMAQAAAVRVAVARVGVAQAGLAQAAVDRVAVAQAGEADRVGQGSARRR
jgi:hypothetical protein